MADFFHVLSKVFGILINNYLLYEAKKAECLLNTSSNQTRLSSKYLIWLEFFFIFFNYQTEYQKLNFIIYIKVFVYINCIIPLFIL